jgi:23S rRNA pseudouridine955/2504/2580 synthase/23S rRNA pseudouridine1911/1915/1917 synthase
MHKQRPDIVFENDAYIILNKPSGMLTLPDRHDEQQHSLRGWLTHHYGHIYVVHRLDRDTSGIILFAKTEAAHKYFSRLFEGRDIEKIYQGIVLGVPLHAQGSIDAPIAEHPAQNGTMVVYKKGKASHTDYDVVHGWGPYSLLQFRLHTGRTHQIRVHCKHIGHPIACDPLYGDGKPVLLSSIKRKFKLSKLEENEKPLLSRLALHAFSLRFTDPAGAEQYFEAPLPRDMKALVSQLSKHA